MTNFTDVMLFFFVLQRNFLTRSMYIFRISITMHHFRNLYPVVMI